MITSYNQLTYRLWLKDSQKQLASKDFLIKALIILLFRQYYIQRFSYFNHNFSVGQSDAKNHLMRFQMTMIHGFNIYSYNVLYIEKHVLRLLVISQSVMCIGLTRQSAIKRQRSSDDPNMKRKLFNMRGSWPMARRPVGQLACYCRLAHGSIIGACPPLRYERYERYERMKLTSFKHH